MLCQKCGLSGATVHRESTVFRQKVEEHLCELCAGVGTAVLAGRSSERHLGVVSGISFYGANQKGGLDLAESSKNIAVAEQPKFVTRPFSIEVILDAIQRVFASTESSCGLTILSKAEGWVVKLTRIENTIQFGITLTQLDSPALESSVRSFFAERSIPLITTREIPTHPRPSLRLFYGYSGPSRGVATLIVELLICCFHIHNSDLLGFYFFRA